MQKFTTGAVCALGLVFHTSLCLAETPIVGSESANPVEGPTAAPAPKKPAPKPWKGLFFNNDFSSVNDPEHDHLLGEALKDIFLGDEHWFSYGGEIRFRFMNEDNRIRPGFPRQNNYQLWRWRQYLDYHHSDLFRAYFEWIDSASFNPAFPG